MNPPDRVRDGLGARSPIFNTVDYLELLAKRAITPNPGIPLRFEEDQELCLVDYGDSSLEEISF